MEATAAAVGGCGGGFGCGGAATTTQGGGSDTREGGIQSDLFLAIRLLAASKGEERGGGRLFWQSASAPRNAGSQKSERYNGGNGFYGSGSCARARSTGVEGGVVFCGYVLKLGLRHKNVLLGEKKIFWFACSF